MFCNLKGTTKAVLKNKFTTLMIFVLFVLPFFRNDSRLIVVIAKKNHFKIVQFVWAMKLEQKKILRKTQKLIDFNFA